MPRCQSAAKQVVSLAGAYGHSSLPSVAARVQLSAHDGGNGYLADRPPRSVGGKE